uniref:Group II intron, maturase-specific domain n=1 Tax=Candidatus Kentrum sp. LFY TaxID=2126342 RepID=A0A450WUJ0_9GAMM|nr:MAG: Group II intron, maturase-specific domain [Candidatus Kentron sp. LFY]
MEISLDWSNDFYGPGSWRMGYSNRLPSVRHKAESSPPLLANIALNSLDWLLHRQGLHFVRYADDFVIMCRNRAQAEEALTIVQSHLEGDLELKSSPEKTHIATFSQGFSFLGFDFLNHSVTMRTKSLEKFKAKIQDITERHHNLDDKLIKRINQIVRGTANYFATWFSHNRRLFKETDKWIRMRLRCMKYKRKWRTDNRRLRLKHLQRTGLLSLYDFYQQPA